MVFSCTVSLVITLIIVFFVISEFAYYLTPHPTMEVDVDHTGNLDNIILAASRLIIS